MKFSGDLNPRIGNVRRTESVQFYKSGNAPYDEDMDDYQSQFFLKFRNKFTHVLQIS